MRPPIPVSVIIVNYNSGTYLSNCIASILQQTIPWELIIIDNASVDGSLECVPLTDNIRVHRNETNLGFAKAQNQGMKLARGKYILPLNFDVLLEPTFLEEMVDMMESSVQIGSVAPKMLRMSTQFEKTRRIENAGILLLSSRSLLHRGRDEIDTGQYDEPVRVFGAMGAAALYRREMLADIAYQGQYFDESYFMWYEDIDLEWRARLRGWACVYAPRAVAYHVGDPHGHGRSKFGAQTSMSNRWKMILTNECLQCFTRNFGALAGHELRLIRHVLKSRLLSAYIRAVLAIFREMPEIIRKRRWVRSRAKSICLPEYPSSVPGGE